jgi:hypothetical protein
MQFDTLTSAQYVARNLDNLLERAQRDTQEVLSRNNIPETVAYFAKLKATVQELQARLSEMQKHIDLLSGELIPTMFTNQDVKTIRVDDIGLVTVNDRWSCMMLKPDDGLAYLRETQNGGLIKETVHPQTMGAHARSESEAGRPLPEEIFKVSQTPYVSIRKN